MELASASPVVALTAALEQQTKSDPRTDEYRREPDAIHAELRKRLGDTDLSEELEELLYGVYPDKDLILAATKMFGLKYARYTGVGFFPAKKDSWMPLGSKCGYGGYIRCGVKDCPWHMKIEEATQRRVCVFKVNLIH